VPCRSIHRGRAGSAICGLRVLPRRGRLRSAEVNSAGLNLALAVCVARDRPARPVEFFRKHRIPERLPSDIQVAVVVGAISAASHALAWQPDIGASRSSRLISHPDRRKIHQNRSDRVQRITQGTEPPYLGPTAGRDHHPDVPIGWRVHKVRRRLTSTGNHDDPVPERRVVAFAAADVGQSDIARRGDPFCHGGSLVRSGRPCWKPAELIWHSGGPTTAESWETM
jgi:hypothetical protein